MEKMRTGEYQTLIIKLSFANGDNLKCPSLNRKERVMIITVCDNCGWEMTRSDCCGVIGAGTEKIEINEGDRWRYNPTPTKNQCRFCGAVAPCKCGGKVIKSEKPKPSS